MTPRAFDERLFIKAAHDSGDLTAYRLGTCPRGGGWCTSQCQYDGHGSPWRSILYLRGVTPSVAAAVAKRLRIALADGNNHDIDVSMRYSDGGVRTVHRGWDLGTPAKIEAFCDEVRDLLAAGWRQRVYGDDHDVHAEIDAMLAGGAA